MPLHVRGIIGPQPAPERPSVPGHSPKRVELTDADERVTAGRLAELRPGVKAA